MINDNIPSFIDDGQLNETFTDGFSLSALVSEPSRSVESIAHALCHEKKRGNDVANVYDFFHLSVIRVRQSMLSIEKVCLVSWEIIATADV